MATGKITLSPPDDTQLYLNQILILTATIEMFGENAIPKDSYITIKGSGFVTMGVGSTVQPIQQSDWQHGTATFTLGVISSEEVVITSAKASFGDDDVTAGSAKYDKIGTAVVNSIPLSKTYIPAAPDDNQLPSADEYTTEVGARVLDSEGKPVKGYVIRWTPEARNIDLLLSRVRTFLSKTATEPLKEGDPQVIDNGEDGYYIRTTTDENGITKLYLVSKMTSGGIGVWGQLYHSTTYGDNSATDRFAMVDLKQTIIMTPPEIEGLNGGILYFPNNGPNNPIVNVGIPYYKNADIHDWVFTFLNGSISYGSLYSPQIRWNSYFYKADAYSDSGDHAGDENIVQYVVGASGADAYVSVGTNFFGKGDRGNTMPPEGTLLEPSVETDPNYPNIINWKLVQKPILVNVPLVQQNWRAQKGDEITVTAYLHGYLPHTSTERTSLRAYNPMPYMVNDYDILIGYVIISLEKTDFAGWDRKATPPFTKGQCYVAYHVFRRVADENWDSHYSTYVLGTVPPGGG